MEPSKKISSVPDMINLANATIDVARNDAIDCTMAERGVATSIANAQATLSLTMAVMEVNTTLREMLNENRARK